MEFVNQEKINILGLKPKAFFLNTMKTTKKRLEYIKKWRKKNKDNVRKACKRYYEKNKKRLNSKEYRKKWKYSKKKKEWIAKNRKHLNELSYKYQRKKIKEHRCITCGKDNKTNTRRCERCNLIINIRKKGKLEDYISDLKKIKIKLEKRKEKSLSQLILQKQINRKLDILQNGSNKKIF